jgi:hypothetical protein
VDMERFPLRLVRIIEELLESKVAAPALKSDINGCKDPFGRLRDTPKLTNSVELSTTREATSFAATR